MCDIALSTQPMTWAGACARRMDRHGLSVPAGDAAPADLVAAMCGAHAQVMSAAELSVGLRADGLSRTDVREALWDEHGLVKTFGPRGTVHLLPMRDLPMWTGALGALPQPANPFPEEVRLGQEQTDAVVSAIGDALQDAELTVDELDAAVVDRLGGWVGERVVPAWYQNWPRWRPAMYRAADRGVLCFGPNRGRTVTYTNPRRWSPHLEPMDGDRALADLVLRYLYSFGPATPGHLARWLAMPRPWATALFESLAGQIEQVDVDGTTAWVAAGDTELPDTAPTGVRLLPYFDAFSVGCQPREQLFPGRAAERALAGGQAGNYPVLVVDGVVAGVWHQRRSGRRVHVTVEPLRRLSASRRRDLDRQVQRVGEVLEAVPELTVGTVEVGPHA